mmetsp:Transcript_5863/g.16462  ORF Transcript_5863/g.16462 Transcript_5863/m.16462 type:complete len:282 (+) Transcript_5863:6-851(+)
MTLCACTTHTKVKGWKIVGMIQIEFMKRRAASEDLTASSECLGQSKKDFDLKGHCDNNPEVYGSPGSKLRHKVQLKWGQIKLRTINRYCKYLRQHGIEFGSITRAELDHFLAKERKKMDYRDKNNSSDDEDHSSSGDESGSSISSASTNSTKSETVSTKTSNANKGYNTNIFSPPIKKIKGFKKKGRQPAKKDKEVDEAADMMKKIAFTPTPEAFVPINWLIEADGSRQRPWIVNVRVDRPDEANNFFDIEIVDGVKEAGFKRKVFNIRRSRSFANWSRAS